MELWLYEKHTEINTDKRHTHSIRFTNKNTHTNKHTHLNTYILYIQTYKTPAQTSTHKINTQQTQT